MGRYPATTQPTTSQAVTGSRTCSALANQIICRRMAGAALAAVAKFTAAEIRALPPYRPLYPTLRHAALTRVGSTYASPSMSYNERLPATARCRRQRLPSQWRSLPRVIDDGSRRPGVHGRTLSKTHKHKQLRGRTEPLWRSGRSCRSWTPRNHDAAGTPNAARAARCNCGLGPCRCAPRSVSRL